MNGWVLSVMWAWFIVPTFNAPTLSIPMAIGISMVVGLLTYQNSKNDKEEESYEWARIIGSLLVIVFGKPLLVLFLAWVVYQFV
jgi:hypothetical protein